MIKAISIDDSKGDGLIFSKLVEKLSSQFGTQVDVTFIHNEDDFIRDYLRQDIDADIIFIDQQLHHSEGITLLKDLRRKDPNLPIIMYSSSKLKDYEQDAEASGATRVVTKYLTPLGLNQILTQLNLTSKSRHHNAS